MNKQRIPSAAANGKKAKVLKDDVQGQKANISFSASSLLLLPLKGEDMRFFVAVIFFALTAFPASAASVESWAELARIINSRQITNIDDLLASLKNDAPEFVSGYTLVYRTRALNQESVSPRRPRVLLFGQNAKLVLAYNSHRTGGKARPGDLETIETLEFNGASGESRLREVEFNGRTVPDLAQVKVNPDRCLACHAATSNPHVRPALTVRGLWDPYNSWAGVYGSLSREDIDFIKFGTREFSNFQEFLAERPKNPRYSYLTLSTKKLSEVFRVSPRRINDALTFSNGYSSHPNQILGMYLADYNFHRVGNILADLPVETRAAFQYLIRGLTVDEKTFVQADIDPQTNATQVEDKTYSCLNNIASFLPDSMSKISFDEFKAKFLNKLRFDYAVRKALVEVDNMGLSKIRPGFDPTDPYDEDRDFANARRLHFDSINPMTHLHYTRNPDRRNKAGYWAGTALFYLFYLMDLPSQDFNTAIARGQNVLIDANYVLSGSTSISYGNAARCYALDGKIKRSRPANSPGGRGGRCESGGADEFFTAYLPPSFYPTLAGSALDPQLDARLTCNELATRSKAGTDLILRRTSERIDLIEPVGDQTETESEAPFEIDRRQLSTAPTQCLIGAGVQAKPKARCHQ